jgi:hypothetical protein
VYPVWLFEKLLPQELDVNMSDLKGTVSPDIVFYFRVYKFKSVLLVRPLMVFRFVYFVVL